MLDSKAFQSALRSMDLLGIRKIPKSDLHVHAALGGNRLLYFNSLPEVELFDGYVGMKEYIRKNLHPYMDTKEKYLRCIQETIEQSAIDGVSFLNISIDYRFLELCGEDSVTYLQKVAQLSDNCKMRFDLGISRSSFNEFDKARDVLSSGFFYGIDLYGDEAARDVHSFKELFYHAKKCGLKTKAHVGEYGSPEEILRAVELLNLDEIQHGIMITNNREALSYMRYKGIRFNVCVTSNIKLGIVNSYADHPVKKMYHEGLNITLNSDDNLLFNSSVSEEYLKLFYHGVFSERELDDIRQNGLGTMSS